MAKLCPAKSLWLDRFLSPRQAHQYPTCRGDSVVDVAVVCGGVTDAAVAWMFAEAGGRAALLEATRVGRGSTAASTALLMQEPDKEFSGPMCRDTSRAPLKADPTYVASPYATPR